MKVAVIGAAGWAGRAVLENFAGRPQVRAFDYDPKAWEVYQRFDGDWEGEKVYGDVADFHAILSADTWRSGVAAVISTGLFGNDWSLATGEVAWAE